MPHTSSNETVRGLRQRLKRSIGLNLEALEQRWLLSASATIDSSALDDTLFSGELVQQLDPYRQLYDINGQLFELIVEPVPQRHDADGVPLPAEFDDGSNNEGVIAQAHGGVHAANGIPLLHSLPDAPAKVFLDFDGNFEPRWGGNVNVVTPAYDIDGDSTAYSPEEQQRIIEAWARVTEDYAPFNVDVTTEDPSDAVTTLNQVRGNSNRIRTFYFRRSFQVDDASQVSNLMVSLLRDDGAAIYLNGVEIVRDNLPANAAYDAFAIDATGGNDEDTFFDFAVDAGLLVNGENVLAVEVHQVNDTSSDVSFDLSLTGTIGGGTSTLVSAASAWRYLDDGSNQGTAWRTPQYNDSAWPSGNAQFGYGEDDEQTELEIHDAGIPRVRTYYFRHEFNIENLAQTSDVVLNLLRDDGAAVYLNGTEIRRDNLPVNAAFDTLASTSIGGADESRFFASNVNADLLVAGRNVLAVEVHQNSDTSSDVSFDLELVATVGGVQDTPLVSAGSAWKYLDDGSDQGTAWRATNFDDATWSSGTAQFGYGDVEVGTVHVAIGPEDWFEGGAGGVAFVGGFSATGRTVAYAFTNGAGNGSKNIAEVASHEAGHAFGLGHQSTFDPRTGAKLEEYNPGAGDWAPIMGVSYSPALTTWHNGPTGSATNFQNDMARIARSSNGFGYRTDDHPATALNATPLLSVADPSLGAQQFEVTGIIERNNDVDAFSFSLTDQQKGISLELRGAELGTNLNAVLELQNSAGETINIVNPPNSYGAELAANLPAGDYTLYVKNTGQYGRVGQYTIRGEVDEPVLLANEFERFVPLGSLVRYSDNNMAKINFAGDVDTFTVPVQAGQTLSASVVPENPAAVLSVELVAFGEAISSQHPGQAVALPAQAIDSDGLYQFTVEGDRPTGYYVEFALNATLESAGSSANNAVDITSSAPRILSDRLAAIGNSGDGGDATMTLVSSGAQWQYLDDGSDPGNAWIAPDFNAANWSSGASQFGYGDADEVTLLDEFADDGDRIRTFYFRHEFDVSDSSVIDNLVVGLLRDDGAAVYLNGVEILRSNLASGAEFDDFALGTVNNEDEFVPTGIPVALLVDGNNVIAAEVHQAADTSSDVSFDLSLRANVVPAPAVRFPLIPAGSDWRYLDDGSNQGVAWRAHGFNDATWPTSTSQFGYGEGDEQTEIDENRSNGSRIRTFYFRRAFDVNNANGVNRLIVRLQRDDGAAVYINGVEVLRDNLAASARSNDFATSSTSGADEDRFFEFAIDPSVLVNGINVVAVEVHQSSDTSSDVSFDLELVVEEVPNTVVSLLDTGATWRYLDDGSNQRTEWRETGFNDTTWPQGSAQLGYGDGDEATQLDERDFANNRIRTYYFRRAINVPDPDNVETLLVELLYDDGIAVYLNGVEIIREGLAAGAGFDDFASSNNPSEDEFFEFEIPPDALVAGTNVLAVEVHQVSDTSSDVSFDMSVRARQKVAEVDSYTFALGPGDIGKSIEVFLAGKDESFANELIQLIGPNGVVIANSNTGAPPVGNYELAIHDVIAPAAGVYTVLLRSFARSDYGLLVTLGAAFEAESPATTSLGVGQVGFGFLGEDDTSDTYAVALVAGQQVAVIATVPFGDTDGTQESGFDPALQVLALDGTVVAMDSVPGHNPPTFTAAADGIYEINVSNLTGSGEYTLRVALPGDANLDGQVDAIDFNVWNTNKFRPGVKLWTDADFNGDRVTDGSDFNIWSSNRFRTLPVTNELPDQAAHEPPRAPLAAHAIAPPVGVNWAEDSLSRSEHTKFVSHVFSDNPKSELLDDLRQRRRLSWRNAGLIKVDDGAANSIVNLDLPDRHEQTVDWLFSHGWEKFT